MPHPTARRILGGPLQTLPESKSTRRPGRPHFAAKNQQLAQCRGLSGLAKGRALPDLRLLFCAGLTALAAFGFLLAADARAQIKGDASKRPTFQDDRRWAPKPESSQTLSTQTGATQTGATQTAPAPGGTIEAPPPTPTPLKSSLTDAAAKLAGPSSCGTPSAKPQALEAGRMRVTITSSCRGGQEIRWTYGGGEFDTRLDAAGRVELIVDAFAGTSTPVEIKFADQTVLSLPVEALDLDKVSKIAVLWRAPVDLDLHAFEYAALVDHPGHISAASPSSLAAAREWIEKSARGRGFLSTRSTGTAQDRLQVYTFLHKDGQTTGLITTALDYETRGERPQPAHCGKGEHAAVPFRVVTWSRSAQVVREAGVLAAVECGRELPLAQRLNPAWLPSIRIRH